MNSKRNILALLSVIVTWACFPVHAVHGDDNTIVATAPDGYVEIADTMSGSVFIAKPLKEKYDALLAKLENLRDRIETGRTDGPEAQRDLANLQKELAELREFIKKNMTNVPVAYENKTKEITKFQLGPNRRLVITADNAQIIGWDKQHVECVVEKVVLSKAKMPVDEHFAAIKAVHEHGKAEGLVGKTKAEYDAEEQEYLDSEDGKKLDARQLESRRKFVDSIHSQFAIYKDFQGKEIDTIQVVGLTGQEGNRQISLQVKGTEGESHRSVWQRYAKLTVYVPATAALAVRGGQEHLDIQNLQSDLLITGQGSHNRDYDGQFKVSGVQGSVVVDDTPITLIENVSGNVSITSTMDYANSGTQHDGGSVPNSVLRTHYYYPALEFTCKDIRGNLSAWFSRVDLNIENVTGKIDVRNEFGNTTLKINGQVPAEAHRVISEAGRIEVVLKPDNLGDLPLFAITQCGTVRTNANEQLLDSVSLYGADDQNIVRHWSGFRRPAAPGVFDFIHPRFSAAINGEDREAGIDVISRGGTVVVTVPE